ncbi:MAG: BatD family protein [Candidatus Auribacterota bacterium]
MVRRLAVFLFLFVLSTPLYCADETAFKAAVSQDTVSLDQSIVLQLTAEGFEPDAPPDLSQVNDFTIISKGSSTTGSSQISITINGQQKIMQKTQSIIYQYELIPKQTGVFVIPAISASYKGKMLRTSPIRVTVTAETPDEDKDVFLEFSLSETNTYVEKPIVMELKWYFSKNIQQYGLSIPFLPAMKNMIIKNIEPDTGRYEYKSIAYNNQVEEIFEYSSTIRNNKRFNVLTLKKIFVPASDGVYLFDPVVLRCEVITQTPYDQYGLRGGFFNRVQNVVERRVVRTEPVTLNVKPLPPSPMNYPSSVSVGNYTMQVESAPDTVKVGDPVTVSITIRGEGNIEGIVDPEFQNMHNFRTFQEDAVVETTINQTGIQGSKTFKFLLIPLAESVTQVPPVRFSYFDPKKGTYQQITSNPVPITVHPGEAAPQSIIISAKSESEGKKEVTLFQTDLPEYIKFSTGTMFFADEYDYTRAWFIACFVVPLILNGLLAVLMYRRRMLASNESLRRRQIAKKSADTLLKKAHDALHKNNRQDFYTLIIRALNEYLGNKMLIPSAGLTFDVVKDQMQKYRIDAKIVDKIGQYYRNADMARFMPSASEAYQPEVMIDDIQNLIKQLEKCKWD